MFSFFNPKKAFLEILERRKFFFLPNNKKEFKIGDKVKVHAFGSSKEHVQYNSIIEGVVIKTYPDTPETIDREIVTDNSVICCNNVTMFKQSR